MNDMAAGVDPAAADRYRVSKANGDIDDIDRHIAAMEHEVTRWRQADPVDT